MYVLLRPNPGVQLEHLFSYFSWVATSLLAERVSPVYLVDELILMFYTPLSHSGTISGSFDVFQHMVSMV